MARKLRSDRVAFHMEDDGIPGGLAQRVNEHLAWMRLRNLSAAAINPRGYHLRFFVVWCAERSIHLPAEVTRRVVEGYQQAVADYRQPNGRPLLTSSQLNRIAAVQRFFLWLVRHEHLASNPAAHIELPKVPKSLPRNVLDYSQMELVLARPDVTLPTGLRDRALLEVLYSTGIRRMELAHLLLTDIDAHAGTVFVHLGKGQKDRVVPIGERALHWVARYVTEARPLLQPVPQDASVLFLTHHGERFTLDHLTGICREHVKAAGFVLHNGGACHLFRHSMATAMLENGADIRFIQAILGHERLETTSVYTRVAISKLKDVHRATHPARLPSE